MTKWMRISSYSEECGRRTMVNVGLQDVKRVVNVSSQTRGCMAGVEAVRRSEGKTYLDGSDYKLRVCQRMYAV